ncbi:MAG TPA: M48 family metallopeptidase [Terriglobia bacterium]|nr:M48 family metallopeptidase [Terriglobia bacterium]
MGDPIKAGRDCLIMWGCFTLGLVLFVMGGGRGARAFTGKAISEQAAPAQSSLQGVANQNSPPPDRYTLAPEQRARAVAYSHIRYILYFLGTAFALGVYFLLWRAKVAIAFRNWARGASSRHFVQCLIFVPLFFVSVSLIEFPLEYYSGFALEKRFGFSNQTFLGWLADWGKALGITVVSGVLVVWILYSVIRRSPRRWWLYFWLVTVPLTLGMILVEPLVIDPLFYKYTPLEQTHPALTARIELMLHRAGLSIPESRILEMDASTKTNAVNAYVNGIGSSKRVVVWDTTLRVMNEDETLLVLGHETGHYVLGHVLKGFVEFEAGAFFAFWIGFYVVERILKRPDSAENLEGVGDLASLPVLLLVLTVLTFASTPVYCALSRQVEQQADQFGLEVAYGVVPDPNAAEARSLQILGEQDLEDPDPPAFFKFWLYTHPPLDERIRFATSYKPWAEGKPMELVRPK